MRFLKYIVFSLSFFAVQHLAFAKDDIKVPATLKSAVEAGQIKVHSEFKVTDSLRGVILQEKGEYFLVYETSDGYLIQGNVYAPTGESLTDEHLAKVPAKEATEAFKAFEALPLENLVIEGAMKAKHHVYVVVDLNCTYCVKLWKASRPYLEKHKDVQIRWVLVALLSEDSKTKALGVFESDKPLETFTYYKSNYDNRVKGAAKGTDKAERILAQNTQLFRSLGYRGTPVVVYPDKDGVAREIGGMPKLPKLAEALNKPYIANTDPSLKRFE